MSENQASVDPSVYSQVFDVSPQGICLIDKKGIYINVNQSFAELLGYATKADLIGKSKLISSSLIEKRLFTA